MNKLRHAPRVHSRRANVALTAQTVAEKILSAHAGRAVFAGDFAVCPVDFAFGQDGTSSIIIDRIRAMQLKELKADFCMVIDHSAPSPNEGVSRVHKKMREFAEEYKTGLFDIGCGVCHQVIPESGKVLPGDLVLGADSHTCTYGALGVFSTGVGSTDLAVALATGSNWFKVPATYKIVLDGTLPKGVFAKDLILHIIADLKADGATYKAVEFDGPAVRRLGIDGRMTICNMVVEMGAKAGFMPVDEKTIQWYKERGVTRPLKITKADAAAAYERVITYDVSKIKPLVSKPHAVDTVASAAGMRSVKIDEAFLGTCTNGRLDDFAVAAGMLKKRTVARGVKFIVAPASKSIYLEAIRRGFIDTFIAAGAVVVAPGCGPCVGTHNGVPADGETVISTANRNFKGRMGNPKAFIYLGSPATVVASALNGRITDPRAYL